MQQATGILSKISENQYSLLTMDGELLLEGNLELSNGFHSDIDLLNISVSRPQATQLIAPDLFRRKTAKTALAHSDCECGDCPDDCDCNTECACTSYPDDCSTPNDCDCECAPK